jgi:hypothetical protein
LTVLYRYVNTGLGFVLQRIDDLQLLSSYQDQLYAALCFCVLNSVEKLLRMSLVDPWMHDKGDGFPILYVRSHAARLPGGLIRDWIFRCRVMLMERAGKLNMKVRAGTWWQGMANKVRNEEGKTALDAFSCQYESAWQQCKCNLKYLPFGSMSAFTGRQFVWHEGGSQ